MGGRVLDGKRVAGEIREELRVKVEEYTGQGRRPPGLAAVLVADDVRAGLVHGQDDARSDQSSSNSPCGGRIQP